jgi:hypothetical protein
MIAYNMYHDIARALSDYSLKSTRQRPCIHLEFCRAPTSQPCQVQSMVETSKDHSSFVGFRRDTNCSKWPSNSPATSSMVCTSPPNTQMLLLLAVAELPVRGEGPSRVLVGFSKPTRLRKRQRPCGRIALNNTLGVSIVTKLADRAQEYASRNIVANDLASLATNSPRSQPPGLRI